MTTLRPPRSGTTVTSLRRVRSGIDLILQEARPGVQLVFLMRCIAGMALAGGGGVSRPVAVLPLGWLMLSVAVYVFNGIGDVDGDRRNGSDRPLATGRLSVTSAKVWAAVLAALGVAVCLVISLASAIAGLAFLLLGWSYSAGPRWKRSAIKASGVIGAGAGLSYIAGMAGRGGAAPEDYVLPALLAIWIGIASNAKDFSDQPGDAAVGRCTLPVILGPSRAAKVVLGMTLTWSVVVVGLVVTTGFVGPAVGIALAIGSVYFGLTLARYARADEAHERRRGYRAFMTTQYAVNIALTLGW